jgi:endonuclease/exonuclease/phosphatase family metal-dependent hydrolase
MQESKPVLRLGTWNVNNRVGKVRFRPEAAEAVVALAADVIVLTEYFPRHHHEDFCRMLARGGLVHQLLSPEPRDIANRALLVSRLPFEPVTSLLPKFDEESRANTVAVRLASLELTLLGVRVPVYKTIARRVRVWEWLEQTAMSLIHTRAVILGDLNCPPAPSGRGAGLSFRRMLQSGWRRAAPPEGHSYFGVSGCRSEIDHILASAHCTIDAAKYVTRTAGFTLAGAADAISDHAALLAELSVADVEQLVRGIAGTGGTPVSPASRP